MACSSACTAGLAMNACPCGDCRIGAAGARASRWPAFQSGGWCSPQLTRLAPPWSHRRSHPPRRSGSPADQAEARRLSQGLLKCASVSDVPGFVARGIGPDGRRHYPLSSDDQIHPWLLGPHAFFPHRTPSTSASPDLLPPIRGPAFACVALYAFVACGWGLFKCYFLTDLNAGLFFCFMTFSSTPPTVFGYPTVTSPSFCTRSATSKKGM